jgi:hypothetical protein
MKVVAVMMRDEYQVHVVEWSARGLQRRLDRIGWRRVGLVPEEEPVDKDLLGSRRKHHAFVREERHGHTFRRLLGRESTAEHRNGENEKTQNSWERCDRHGALAVGGYLHGRRRRASRHVVWDGCGRMRDDLAALER